MDEPSAVMSGQPRDEGAAGAPGQASASEEGKAPGRVRLFFRRLFAPLRRLAARCRESARYYRFELTLTGLFFAAGFVLLLPLIYHTVPAGHVGVLWKRFAGGTQLDLVVPEGYRLTFPWDRLFIYDNRLQTVEHNVNVLSSDGLHITLTLVWRFHLKPQWAPYLHKFIGPNYAETMVAPTVEARARDIVAVYSPEEVYTQHRLAIENEILESVRFDIQENLKPDELQHQAWLEFEDVLIKGMVLPPGVQEAIVRKNAMFQEMEEYSFRLQREQKEAERKRIEAVGIRNFQEIVSNGMTEEYLRWRGIEATLELAKSPNSKVVVVGGGKTGLPIILNADAKDISPSQAASAAAKSEAKAAKLGPKASEQTP